MKNKYPKCKKHGTYFRDPCPICETEKRRKAEGLCCAKLCHGPGHQSTTYCHKKGKHTIHEAIYGQFEQYATWKGSKPKFTGYFDDAPTLMMHQQ